MSMTPLVQLYLLEKPYFFAVLRRFWCSRPVVPRHDDVLTVVLTVERSMNADSNAKSREQRRTLQHTLLPPLRTVA